MCAFNWHVSPFMKPSVVDDDNLVLCCAPSLAALAEQLNHGAIEGRNVIRLTARHHVAVSHRFFIDPLGAGIAQVSLKRRPGSNAPSARSSGFNNRPWS